jgi:coenzyme F420 biosynthesis associated uncharacterized protein
MTGERPAGRPPRDGRGFPWRDDRVWQAGFLVGSLAGAAATVLTRRLERSARGGLVDWPRAEALAVRRLRRAPGALPVDELRAAEGSYAEAMARIEPLLSGFLGTPLPGVVERASVVDRAGWVEANISAFRTLVGHLENGLLEQVIPPGGGFTRSAMAIANRYLTTQQIGYFLGFMGQRVLGQYDLALLSAEAAPGRLLFVEENIRATARALDVPLVPFRVWIALHETTHAFEFEAHPWLRPYLAERLERQLSAFSADAASLSRDALGRLGRSLRSSRAGDHWMERLMTDEQRRLFRETQAVMSLLEGFSDYVMDEVGREIVPDVQRISTRFHERRQRRSAMERAILRLSGMDLKMEQYRSGERFVSAVAAVGGKAALGRLWEGPENLPRAGEIERPRRWIARVVEGRA